MNTAVTDVTGGDQVLEKAEAEAGPVSLEGPPPLITVPDALLGAFAMAADTYKDQLTSTEMYVLLGIRVFGWQGFRKQILGQ